MLILGIESTCDETGVAVVEDGVKIRSNFIASSVSKLAKYGGVVPEVVARDQVKFIIPLIEEALSGIDRDKIDAIAVSYGPGLVGSLLIGVETAKTLAVAWKKPLIPVNHLKAHIYSNWLDSNSMHEIGSFESKARNSKKPQFPLVALIVSGGHTDLVLMKDHGDFKLLGSTLDDAAGEAFDKVARVLGLGFPGGPEIEQLALRFAQGKPISKKSALSLPRSMMNSNDFNFSFSGIKTAVANFVHGSQLTIHGKSVIAFEFQEAVCDVLVSKTIRAAKKFVANSIVVGGGVSANSRLREMLIEKSTTFDVNVFFPPKNLSVDNGAMIAAAAFFEKKFSDPLKTVANPLLHF